MEKVGSSRVLKKIPCSFVVLNYQGLEELKRCFPSVAAACEVDGWIHDLILLDNHSTDGSPEWVEKHFPKVHVVRRPDNLVCHAFNEIAKELSCEFCIFLNNDFIVEKYFIQKLLRHFEDPDVVAVSPLLIFKSSEDKKNVHRLRFHKGFLEMVVAPCEASPSQRRYTFHASSYGAYRRKKFLELGGYDPLLFPFSWIDVDFSYRVWKAGFKVAHERETFVSYDVAGNTTARIFGQRKSLLIWRRNRLLTTWLNVTDKRLLAKSLLFGFFDCFKALLGLHLSLVIPFWWCLKKTPSILKTRRARKRMAKLSDGETLKKIEGLCV